MSIFARLASRGKVLQQDLDNHAASFASTHADVTKQSFLANDADTFIADRLISLETKQ